MDVMSNNHENVSSANDTSSYASMQAKTNNKIETSCQYLKEHILDELDGAKDYMMKAVEWKQRKPEWSKHFYRMSEMEAEHATTLTKMFTSVNDEDELCLSKMYKDIMDSYNTNMLEVANLKKLYYS